MLQKLLVVDLGKEKATPRAYDPADAKAFIGGSGLGAKWLYDHANFAVEPLSPENILLFQPGPLTGSGAPDTGRHTVCFKSPLTGCWGEANAGGDWGSWLRYSGWDGLAVTGRAREWTTLVIEGDSVKFQSAKDLVGKDTYQTQEALGAKDYDTRVACIGAAGENLVKYAAIVSEDGRAAARGGPGAVMGAKRLKAVVAKRVRKVPVEDPEKFREATKHAFAHMKKSPVFKMFQALGTAGYMEMAEMMGDVSIKYFTEGQFKAGAKKVSGSAMKASILTGNEACHSCPIRCARVVEVPSGPFAIPGGETAGPEYETTSVFGPLVMNENLEAIAHANWLCNKHGMDTISAGVSVAFAFFLYEKGLITKEAAGRELPWGDPAAMNHLVEATAHRKGIGDVIAEGTRVMGAKYNCPQWAAHVKGMELPMHDARAFFSMAAEYATSNRGACHLYGNPFEVDMGSGVPEWDLKPSNRMVNEGKGTLTAKCQDFMAIYNALVICQFAKPSVQQMADLLNAVSGTEYTIPDLKIVGERINNIKRAYNIRAGLGVKDDTMPEIALQPLAAGGTRGKVPDLQMQLKDYYTFRNWDIGTGKPTGDKLKALGLGKVAADLWGTA